MKVRAILILLVALIALSVLFVTTDRRQESGPDTVSGLIPAFDIEHAEIILVSLAGASVELVQENKQWQVTDRWLHPADEVKVKELLEGLRTLTSNGVASHNPEKRNIFEVDEKQGRRLQVLAEGGKALVDVYLGKNGPAYKNTYLRLNGSDEVHQVKGIEWSQTSAEEPAWLAKRLFDLEIDEITGITLEKKDQVTGLVVSMETWKMISPEESGVRQDIVTDMLNSLITLEAQDVESHFSSAEKKIMTPEITLSLTTIDGREITMQAGETDTYLNRLTISGKPYYYLVPGYRLAPFMKPSHVFKEEKAEAEEPVIEETTASVEPEQVEPEEKAVPAPIIPEQKPPATGEVLAP